MVIFSEPRHTVGRSDPRGIRGDRMGRKRFFGRPVIPKKLAGWGLLVFGIAVLVATLPLAAFFGVLLAYIGYTLQRRK
jgi:hypothetical protein